MKTLMNNLVATSMLFAASAVGCAYGDGSEELASQEADVQETEAAVNGTVSFEGCTTAQRTKIRSAVEYLYQRVTDSSLQLELCLADGVLTEDRNYDAAQIATMLQKDVITKVKCAELPNGDGWMTNGQAPVSISGESMTLDPDFVNPNSEVRVASVIAHEIMHNRGFRHQDGPYYSNSVPEQVEACMMDWAPNPAVDVGYALYWDGKRVGYEATWTKARGASNCKWNKDTYPDKKVECFFDGATIGYELYWDGKRAGMEATWTRAQGAANCKWNKDTYPTKNVECTFDGQPIGYELYWDGKRAGYAPDWTKEHAATNCKWNKETYPNKKVECFFDGATLGYELYWDGKRVGMEPTWTVDQGRGNCQWNQGKYDSTKIVECFHDGVRVD